MYEAELAVLMEFASSSTGTNMGLKYSLSHVLFSVTYIQLQTKFKDQTSYIYIWLRATCIQSALTVFTPSNIFLQTRAPTITHMLLLKIIGILMMLAKYFLE